MLKKVNSPKKIRIGTSGFVYKSWHDFFYPKEIKKEYLSFYAQRFNTVEVNSSFYHTPTAKTFAKWREEVPHDFVFALKMNQYITHRHLLKNIRAPLRLFLTRAKKLEKKLGVILVQLPPRMLFQPERIETFLKAAKKIELSLKKKFRFAFEPRHQSWFESRALETMRRIVKRSNAALVFAESSRFPAYEPTKENCTADFVYVRMHGPQEFAASLYGKERLHPWVIHEREWLKEGRQVYVYFNNDQEGFALQDAKTLKKLFTDMQKKNML